MSLLAALLAIAEDWREVFPQQRTFQRGVRQALGSLVCLGRRCLTRIIWTNGGQNRSWSAEYFSPLPLPVGTAGVVPADSQTSAAVLSAAAGRCGPGRYQAAQNRPLDSTGVLPARSFVAALSRQSGVGSALPAGLAVGAAAS